jgi:hypothetical protein
MDNYSHQRQPSKHQTETYAGTIVPLADRPLRRTSATWPQQPQIATKHKDAAHTKGTEHWRASAKRAIVRLELKAYA